MYADYYLYYILWQNLIVKPLILVEWNIQPLLYMFIVQLMKEEGCAFRVEQFWMPGG